MSPDEQDGEYRFTWLDWRDQGEGDVWSNEIFPLLFAFGSMAGLACGLIRLLTLR
jgi:hypothetical protein